MTFVEVLPFFLEYKKIKRQIYYHPIFLHTNIKNEVKIKTGSEGFFSAYKITPGDLYAIDWEVV
jgi:hypothetical protein